MGQVRNSKAIAVNTIVLYIRMIVVMFIALYSSRIVLYNLGVEDYGVYNVIGGAVSLFAFFRTSLEVSTQRYLNYEMGCVNGDVSRIFKSSFTIHLILALLTLVLIETIGLWFVNTYLNIPSTRIIAANWVFQSVVISLLVTIVTVPFSADVVSHENMSFYALVSICDAFLKLFVAIAISIENGDRLILYALLMMCISLFDLFLYFLYSRFHYKEVRIGLLFEKKILTKMFGFTGWTVFGQASSLAANQGNNMLLNIFCGVKANAAMGIGEQVGSAILGLSGSFQKAFNPQITKSYASGDFEYLKKLLYMVSKLSFLLMFVCALLLIFNIEYILNLWLVEVPDGAIPFSILFITHGIVNSLSTPLSFCVYASGNVKMNQICSSCVYLSDLVILYFLFVCGCPPVTAAWVKLYVVVLDFFVRFYFASKYIATIDVKSYYMELLKPLLRTASICLIAYYLLLGLDGDWINRLIANLLLLLCLVSTTYLFALNSTERESILKLLKNKVHMN